MYEPEDMTAPIPPSPITSQDLSTTYYNVYNYQHFILLVNQAIVEAWYKLYLDIREKKVNRIGRPWSEPALQLSSSGTLMLTGF